MSQTLDEPRPATEPNQPEPERANAAEPRTTSRRTLIFGTVAAFFTGGAVAETVNRVTSRPRRTEAITQQEAAAGSPELISEAAQTERRRLITALNGDNPIIRRPRGAVFVNGMVRDGDIVVRNPLVLDGDPANPDRTVWGRVVREHNPDNRTDTVEILAFTGIVVPHGEGTLNPAVVLDNATPSQARPTLFGYVDGRPEPIGQRTFALD